MGFSRCDQQGNGFIGPEEFRQLCSEFDISSVGVSIYINVFSLRKFLYTCLTLFNRREKRFIGDPEPISNSDWDPKS